MYYVLMKPQISWLTLRISLMSLLLWCFLKSSTGILTTKDRLYLYLFQHQCSCVFIM